MAMLATLLATSSRARADGAFPASLSVLLPRDRPAAIVLATNFGLVSTEDDGATWSYTCETGLTLMAVGGGRYVLGPPPQDRTYAISDVGAVYTADRGCTWASGGGALVSLPPPALPLPFDIFPDPSNGMRVFLLAADQAPERSFYYAFRSSDGGATYSSPIYTSAAGVVVTGIESASSAPGTVYLTMYQQGSPVHPSLAISTDGGDTWMVKDIEAGIGNAIPKLAAVDPADARTVYLTISSPAGAADQYQGLAITTDGGATWAKPLNLPLGSLTGFARLSEQVLLVTAGTPDPQSQATVSKLYRSEDGGHSFSNQTLSFQALGLSQRTGTAYVATNDAADGFALVSSTDGGRTWMPRLRLRDISSVKECVRAACEDACNYLVGNFVVFPAQVCTATGPPMSKPGGGGCALAGTLAAPVAPPAAAGGRAGGAAALGASVGVGLGLLLYRRRRRTRQAHPVQPPTRPPTRPL